MGGTGSTESPGGIGVGGVEPRRTRVVWTMVVPPQGNPEWGPSGGGAKRNFQADLRGERVGLLWGHPRAARTAVAGWRVGGGSSAVASAGVRASSSSAASASTLGGGG